MTPSEFKAGRLSLGLSAARTAAAFGVSDGRVIRYWETRGVPGPAAMLMRLALTVPEVRAKLTGQDQSAAG